MKNSSKAFFVTMILLGLIVLQFALTKDGTIIPLEFVTTELIGLGVVSCYIINKFEKQEKSSNKPFN